MTNIIKLVLFMSLLAPISKKENLSKGVDERKNIENVLINSYVNAVFIDFNEESIRKGFNSDFHFHVPMRTPSGESLRKIELNQWITMVSKMKFNNIEYKILEVHVTDDAATTVSEIYQEGKKLYTDYMIWRKNTGNWQIMGKTFAFHQKRMMRR